jgi:hypothetical protein
MAMECENELYVLILCPKRTVAITAKHRKMTKNTKKK